MVIKGLNNDNSLADSITLFPIFIATQPKPPPPPVPGNF